MEKKESEEMFGRKVDETFMRECMEAFLQSVRSGDIARLTKERVIPMKATPRKQQEED